MWTVDIFVCTVCLFHVLFCRADQRSGGISFPLAKNELHFEMFCLNCIFSNSTAKGRKILYTRMHSSRMRTGRTLTVFRSLLFRGGVSGPGGCLVWGGCLVPGGYLPGPGGVPAWSEGGVPGQVLPPPPCGQNDTRLWKYYLGQNFVSAGKNLIEVASCGVVFLVSLHL